MKKINLLLVFSLSVIIFGCQKNEMHPALDTKNPASTLNVPEHNEKNSTAIAWDKLPDQLKNADVISPETNTMNKIYASYKYFIGTWGGSGGGSYAMYPTASTDKIYAIAFRSGAYVDQLIVWYIRSNGTLYYYSAGGTGGAYYVQFLSSSEYVYAIGGRSGAYVDRLTIYTNYKSFSYGGNGGVPFFQSVPYTDQILGFYGGAGRFVDRIGAYVYSK